MQFRVYIILVVLALISFSCSDYLEEDPETFFSEAAIYSSEEGVETAINGVYASFSAPDYYGTAWHNLMMPVSGKMYSSQNANIDATGLNTTSSNINLRKLWAQIYGTINTANIAIANLNETGVELANRDRALGHAHFVRAKCYLDLLRMFGAVPLRTNPANIDELDKARTERSEVVALVISDFNLAKSLMPPASEALYERPGKLVANVYLAKLYCFLAGEDNGSFSYWQKAYDELLPVIESEEYSLTPTYAELFEPGNENTSEALFELQYANTGGSRNADLVRLYTPANSIFAPKTTVTFGRIRPNKETFDQHVEAYADDPRIAATFLFDSYPKITGGDQNIYPKKNTGNQGFAVIAKWFDPEYNGITTERNYILLRYADVLLMMAEIENELNGPAGAYEYVNKVLARARDTDGDGMSDSEAPADWTNLSPDDFRENIMRERQYELLSEGQEWFDTRRRGYQYFLNEVVLLHNSHETFDETRDLMYPESEKNMLLPIPLSEISGNQAIGPEDQNPGY